MARRSGCGCAARSEAAWRRHAATSAPGSGSRCGSPPGERLQDRLEDGALLRAALFLGCARLDVPGPVRPLDLDPEETGIPALDVAASGFSLRLALRHRLNRATDASHARERTTVTKLLQSP